MLCCVMLIRSGCSRNKSPLGVCDLEKRRREHVLVYLVRDSLVKRLVDTNKSIVQSVQQYRIVIVSP